MQRIESELSPVREYGIAEACFSCDWVFDSHSLIAAGMANKFLRLYDIRGMPILKHIQCNNTSR